MTKKRRELKKRPDYNKNYNLKIRGDYIETGYLNGVRDEKDKLVMRPLTDEEKDWLNQFYKETVGSSRKDSKFYTTDEDWKKIYNENNCRNRCLYNKTKMTGKLSQVSHLSDKKIYGNFEDDED